MKASIQVNFTKKTGKKIMPLHGVNSGPMTKVFTYDARPLFVEGGIPLVRLHDSEYPYGSGEFIDIPCVFPNFDADENDPASYNFGNTDEYIRQCLRVGSKILYRLGVSIEHSPVKRYIHPPKDFEKWARICEHIIRHYNEGWANGYEWGIEYWEIWNEADLDRKSDNKRCWTGTAAQFFDLYSVTARHLKKCFPNLKIGGCGFTTSQNDFTEAFLEHISLQTPPVPLDFYSWHCYTSRPEVIVKKAEQGRMLLDRYGYSSAESILDEWNLVYSWDFENQAESYRAMKDHRGAAFYAAALCAMQEHTDLSAATQFEADVVKEFCGIFNVKNMSVGGLSAGGIGRCAELEPTKGFYALKSYNRLYRLGNQVELLCNDNTLWATAATADHGVGVIISNIENRDVSVSLSLLGVTDTIAVRITDHEHTDQKLLEMSAASPLSLSLEIPPQSFVYVGTEIPDPIYHESKNL